MEGEFPGVDAVLVLGPFPFEADDGGFGEGVGLLIDRRVRPDLEVEIAGGIGEHEFEVGFVRFGLAGGAGLELRENRGGDGGFTRLFLEGGDADRTHAPHYEPARRRRKTGSHGVFRLLLADRTSPPATTDEQKGTHGEQG